MIIELTDVEIVEWKVSLIRQCVEINYGLMDSSGNVWVRDVATFWNEIPETFDPEGNPLPTPSNWFQLPLEYASILIDLTEDAKTAIATRFL